MTNTSEQQPITVILVTRDGMGAASTELRHTLITKYFQLLLVDGKIPAAICFYAEGVKLACEGSPVLAPLRDLQDKGAHLIVCQTCLNFLGLMDQLRVGIVGGMADIVEAQWRASKVITL